jgi:acyl transferase domain-containing protein
MSNPGHGVQYTGLEVAVVGMAARLPGAANVEQFWKNLREGVEAISFFTGEQLRAAGVHPELVAHPDFVGAKGVLEDAEMFDAQFFGYNPREAEIMDPQQRVFLECAWEALESAGYDPARYERPVGVYAGVGMNSYAFKFLGQPEAFRTVGPFQAMLGNDKDFLASRVSYKLNLKGPSVTVQTACSTSLVAVHLACQSLLSGECSMALAGGVSVSFPEQAGYVYQEGGILSPDGHCRAFDAAAEGTVGGNGVGVVVLKRLEEALAEGDTILCVIKGSALNNDGSLKVGYTAPSEEGQAEVIRAAHLMAEVAPETVTYVEAHGTATGLGDPIEVAALTRAFRAGTKATNFCALGSVKTNVGHLDTAAGVAGLIKTALALRHREIPPSLHFERPNPKIDFDASPFYVNTRLAEWKNGRGPRRAGVSSFGIGGTNAHVVLEEAPPAPAASEPRRPLQLLTVSAKTETALESATLNLLRHLKTHPEADFADAAYTLQVGRGEFAHRRAVVCHDAGDAVSAFEGGDRQRVRTGFVKQAEGRAVFMFPGQGAQYAGMGRRLYGCEEVFREEVDRCARLLTPHTGRDVRELLFAAEAEAESAGASLSQTAFTQPALFAVEYALARQLMAWGVRPAAMIGHSLGEYVAACLAGVFGLEDALRLVALRGRLMQETTPGLMLAVPLAEAGVLELLEGQAGGAASLAAVNAPAMCVVSGTAGEIEELEGELKRRGVEGRRLHTSRAFHSRLVEPAVGGLTEAFAQVELSAPRIPFVSGVTGRWITEAEARDPAYWGRQLREPVRFAEGLGRLLEPAGSVLVEVGPGRTLCTLVRQNPQKSAALSIISTLPHADEAGRDEETLLGALGQLWLAGVRVGWERLHEGEGRRRVPLPTYPFERQRFTIEVARASKPEAAASRHHEKADVAEWFYAPLWKQTVAPARPGGRGEAERHALPQTDDEHEGRLCRLVFADDLGFGRQLAARLAAGGEDVVTVLAGASFLQLGENEFSLNAGRSDDYRKLISRLREEGRTPRAVAHLWGVTAQVGTEPERYGPAWQERFQEAQERGFYSLLFLARSLEQEGVSGEVRLSLVTNGVQCVGGRETLLPEKATAHGPALVIPQEYPNLTCRGIDVELPEPGTEDERRLLAQLFAELTTDAAAEKFVAYRGGRRWAQVFEPLPAEGVTGDAAHSGAKPLPVRLRERGVYLLTGGLGGVGLALAKYLAEHARARLVLVGRTGLPPRARWEELIKERGASEAVGRTLSKLLELEEAGAEVELVRADVLRESEVREAVRRARERFGTLDGVIHAAGLSGAGAVVPVSETGRAEAERQFETKVYGLLALEKVLRGSELDFCLLTSSLSAVLGGLGFSAYAAANAFMDAFAQQQSQSGRVRWISVDWDGWHLADEGGPTASPAITGLEGGEAFARALRSEELPQLVVSTSDLRARLGRWVSPRPLGEAGGARESKAAARYARPDLQSAYLAPRDAVEQSIAEIWETLLGVERVGVEDNFFELGGHSLLATQLASRVRDAFHVELSLRGFFAAPTVAGLARLIAENLELKERRKLEEILRDVEALDEEEVERALSSNS